MKQWIHVVDSAKFIPPAATKPKTKQIPTTSTLGPNVQVATPPNTRVANVVGVSVFWGGGSHVIPH